MSRRATAGVMKEVQRTVRSDRSAAGTWLIALLAASFALRLAFVATAPSALAGDAGHYDLLARAILDRGEFPSAYRSPGYPAFVAAVYAAAGRSPSAVYLLQAVISTAGVYFVYRLGLELLGRGRWRAALVAAACIGANPEIAAYCAMLLRESLTISLTALAAWLAVRTWFGASRAAWPLGVALAALVYVRAEACLLVLPLLAVHVLRRPRVNLRAGLIAIALPLILAGPWMACCAAFRGYGGMQTAFDSCLFSRVWYLSPQGRVAPELRARIVEVVAASKLSDQEVRRYMIPPRLVEQLPYGDVRAEAALYRQLGAIARENVAGQPAAYAADCVNHLRATLGGYWLFWWPDYWNAPPFARNIRDGQWVYVAVKVGNRMVWPAVMIALTAIATAGLWVRRDRAAGPLALLVLGALAAIALVCLCVCGDPRLRLAYDPVLYIAAVAGWRMAAAARPVQTGWRRLRELLSHRPAGVVQET